MKNKGRYIVLAIIVVCLFLVAREQDKGLMGFTTSDGLTGLYNPTITVGYYIVEETKEIRYLSPTQGRNLYAKWCKNH